MSVVSSPHPITDSASRGVGGGGRGLGDRDEETVEILQTNENMDGERYHQDNRK